MGQNRYVILGLFAILAVGMFFYLAFQVGSFSFHRGKEVTFLFDDATGLKKGGDVKIRGVVAGKIFSLDYRKDKAVVKVRLAPDAEIPRDVAARIRPESLLGEKFLELIVPPGSRAKPIQSGDVITDTGKAIDMNEFVDKFGTFLDRFGTTDFPENLSSVVRTLAENRQRINETIRNLDRLAVNANELISENRTSLEKTIHNLERITDSFSENAPRTARNLDRVLVRLNRLTAELEEKSPDLAEDLGRTLKNLSTASEELPGTLEEFRKLSGRLTTTLDNVDHFLLEDTPEFKEILEKRGIKTRIRIW